MLLTSMSSKSKKRKRTPVVLHQAEDQIDTSKPTSVFQASGVGRAGTLSIALPGSILANAQGLDLKTILAGRIARAAAVFCVDEIVIFDDGQSDSTPARASGMHGNSKRRQQDYDTNAQSAANSNRDPNALLELLLSYAECPPYLRKSLFDYNADLGKSGLLPSLDVPHHLKVDEWCQYREAVSTGPAHTNGLNGDSSHDSHSMPRTIVDAGFPVSVTADIPPRTRLTVKFDTASQPPNWPPTRHQNGNHNHNQNSESLLQDSIISAAPVDPAAPREETGYYWGYTVRRATSLSTVFTESPYEDGYDISIGTSERGQSLLQDLVLPFTQQQQPLQDDRAAAQRLPDHALHVLLVVGGVAGLEVAVEADAELTSKGITRNNVGELFDYYVNVCAGQGSRTIRTEEALWIALSQLRAWCLRAL